jgi:REP element-mobilizing transposase RayT
MYGKYDPKIHHRRSIRLPGYDYSQDGWYYITICALGKKCLFGKFADGQIQLYEYGRTVEKCWQWLDQQYDYVHLDEYVVMPNHLHGIIVIRRDDSQKGLVRCRDGTQNDCIARRGGSRTTPIINLHKYKPLSRLIGAFKTVSTRQINNIRNTPGCKLWQRNYYEHIIRNEEELNHIRRYIAENPANWRQDEENPNVADDP